MSAAATAAGYLYASGRLRGRASREQDPERTGEKGAAPRRREVRVAVYAPTPQDAHASEERPASKRAPVIQYRTRRWRPE
jgi:hypothetical protein